MRKTQILMSIVIALAGSLSFARGGAGGGDLVNNGGGLAEKNILYAYEKMEGYLQFCLNSESCKLNDKQKAIVQQILKGLPQEKKSQDQLVFSSEQKNPGSFIIDGIVRVARTGSTVGSQIIINSDLLYTKTSESYEAVSIPEAVAILTHEFGHHYGHYTHEELDLIGVRISMLLQQKLIMTPLLPWNSSKLSLSVLNAQSRLAFPQVLLTVGDDVIDLSEAYKREIRCEILTFPIPVLPIPDVQLVTRSPSGSVLHNVHWDKIKDRDDVLKVQITGNVSNTCLYKNAGEVRDNNYQLSISFEVKKKDANWTFDASTLKVDQFKNPWWKILRFPNLGEF